MNIFKKFCFVYIIIYEDRIFDWFFCIFVEYYFIVIVNLYWYILYLGGNLFFLINIM